MKAIEVKAREFHRRTAWALKTARAGTPIVIVSRHQPPLTLQAGRPQPLPRAGLDWDEHFKWLKRQAVMESNPVDELRALEKR